MKYCYKRPKFNFYDAVAMECWLSDMAKKGFIYHGNTLAFFRFLKTEPQDIKYRVEPTINDNVTPSLEIISTYEEAGWKFVARQGDLFFIWKSIRDDATELHSDPIVQSESYRRLCKKLTNQAICTSIAVLAIFAIFLSGFLFSDRPVSLFLASPLYLGLLLMEVFTVTEVIMQAIHALKIRKMLSTGICLTHKKDYHKQYNGYRLISSTSLLLAIIVFIFGLLSLTTDWRKNIADIEQTLPFIPLDQIEQSDDFDYKEPFYFNGDGIDYNNYADYSWTLFVSEHYEIYQAGAKQDHKWPDESGYYSPTATTEYYRLNIPALAPLLFEELMELHLWEHEEYIITELDGFERAIIAENGFMKHLFVLEDNQVFYLRYHGYADISDILPLISEKLSS